MVGSDDRVPLVINSRHEQRLVRYGWLRLLLSKAEDPDPPQAKSPTPNGAQAVPRELSTTSQLLKAAKARLEGDLAQSSAPPVPSLDHAPQRAAMQQVLAGPEFRDLQRQSVRDSALEKFGNWLNHLFESAANFKARSAWIGRALVWGFILSVCVALVYSLLRLERRWRVQLRPKANGPLPALPLRVIGNSGLKTRAAQPQPDCGAKQFTSSTGLRFRALNHVACGPQIALALHASTLHLSPLKIRANPASRN